MVVQFSLERPCAQSQTKAPVELVWIAYPSLQQVEEVVAPALLLMQAAWALVSQQQEVVAVRVLCLQEQVWQEQVVAVAELKVSVALDPLEQEVGTLVQVVPLMA